MFVLRDLTWCETKAFFKCSSKNFTLLGPGSFFISLFVSILTYCRFIKKTWLKSWAMIKLLNFDFYSI